MLKSFFFWLRNNFFFGYIVANDHSLRKIFSFMPSHTKHAIDVAFAVPLAFFGIHDPDTAVAKVRTRTN